MKKKVLLPLITSLLAISLISCDVIHSNQSSSSSSESTVIDGDSYTVTLYSINDYHGAAKQTSTNMGIVKLGSYLKEEKAKGNTLLVNSGDMFQGSIESNYSKGAFLTDCMNEIGFDAFTLGNHEFDWGIDYIKANKERVSSNNYQTPWLSSNIYKWDNSLNEPSSERVTDLGELYSVKNLENGLKVGFIGAIGSSQWTSITSKNVSSLTFVDPVPVVKSISDTLRVEEGCDLVFLTYHGSQNELLLSGLTSVSKVSNKKYVDTVFCGHTHKNESAEENGVLFTQNSGYGANASKVVLTLNKDKEVINTELTTIEKITLDKANVKDDQALLDLYAKTEKETSSIGDELLATSTSALKNNIIYVACEAIKEEAIKQGYDIELAMTNNPRTGMSSSNITYAGLMSSLPFENTVTIISAKGRDIINEISYSSNYMSRTNPSGGYLSSDKYYTVAVIDYLAYHMDTSHRYNYFPSMEVVGEITNNGNFYGYRDITADYLRNKERITSSDYSPSNPQFDKSTLGV